MHLKGCLEAGAAADELAGALAVLPSLSALQELTLLRPARDWSAAAAVAASSAGHVEVLQWILVHGHPMGPVECAVVAAAWGHDAILRWFLDRPSATKWASGAADKDWHGSVYGFTFQLSEHVAFAALETFDRVQWPAFEPAEVSLWAGTQGYIPILDWLQNTHPGYSQSASACRGAAASGNLGTMQWLRGRDPPWDWDSYCLRVAAEEGHADVLQWMLSQDPPCEFLDDDCKQAARTAASQGHCCVLEVLLQQQYCSPVQVATWAAESSTLSTLQFLDSSGYLEGLPRFDDLILAAGSASLECAQLLTPYLTANGHALFWALQQSMRRAKYCCMTEGRDLLVIRWFYSQFEGFEPWQIRRLTAAASESPILLELAYWSCGPRLPWDPHAIGIAAVRGSHSFLHWLCNQDQGCSPQELNWRYGECHAGRLMLLVHGLGWSPDGEHRRCLADAEQRRLAFYGVARRLRLAPSPRCGLGSLPEPLLKHIACAADLDFSWTFSA